MGDVYRNPLDSPELWDDVRKRHSRFEIPRNRNGWINEIESAANRDGLDSRLAERAEKVLGWIDEAGGRGVFSVGAGNAALEYHLKKLRPSLPLVTSDFSPGSVELIRGHFEECDRVERFDIMGGDWSAVAAESRQVVLINRLDPVLTNRQWRSVFRDMGESGVGMALMILAWDLDLSGAIQAKLKQWRHRLEGRRLYPTGWARTGKTWRSLWASHYDAEERRLGGLSAYLLRRR